MKTQKYYMDKIYSSIADENKIASIITQIANDMRKDILKIINEEMPQYFYGKGTMIQNIKKIKFSKEGK